MKDEMSKQNKQSPVYKKYWDHALASLKLSKINEMVMANRETPSLLQPLLKCLIILDSSLEVEEHASCVDIVDVLHHHIAKGSASSDFNLLKVCV